MRLSRRARLWRRLRPAAAPRIELVWTFVLDAATLSAAFLCRWYTLKVYQFLISGGATVPWHLRALEIVLDYGIVLAATAFVVFDLAKRVRHGWREFRQAGRTRPQNRDTNHA